MRLIIHDQWCPTVLDEDDNEECYCPDVEVSDR